jgi:hypothetical protein
VHHAHGFAGPGIVLMAQYLAARGVEVEHQLARGGAESEAAAA